MIELIEISKHELDGYAPDFWHTSHWINYCVNSRFSKGVDCTTAMYENGKLIAIAPLIREGEEFTFQGGFCPRVLVEDITKLDKISGAIKHHAYVNDIKRIAIDGFLPGFITYGKQICVSDLNKSRIRKSYRSLTKNKNLEYRIIKPDGIITARDLYYTIAKKQTRPDILWDMYADWIDKGFATMLIAIHNGQDVGVMFVTHYMGEAYYFLSGVLPEYNNLNVSHYLQGIVFEILKNKGITDYVLGDVGSDTLIYSPSSKEDNIAFFKAGWGNQFTYKIVSEYFTDAEYFKKVQEQRLNNYIGAELT